MIRALRPSRRRDNFADLVVERVRDIPAGSVATYGDIDPRAPRRVGYVLATTREELPWHRVVRADGRVALGLEQLERLREEGVPLRGDRVDLRRARVSAKAPSRVDGRGDTPSGRRAGSRGSPGTPRRARGGTRP